MRVLLDECVPRKLRRELPEHQVRTVTEQGWRGTKNGTLLRLASEEFDVFLTVDSNLEHQQNLATIPISVVVMVAYRNDVVVLRLLMPRVRELLPTVEPGRIYRVGPAGESPQDHAAPRRNATGGLAPIQPGGLPVVPAGVFRRPPRAAEARRT